MVNFVLGVLTCFAALLWYGRYLKQKRQREILLRWRQPVWVWGRCVSVRRY